MVIYPIFGYFEITYFAFLTTYFAIFDHINIAYFGPKNHIKIRALLITLGNFKGYVSK